jgi:hypothetical protein
VFYTFFANATIHQESSLWKKTNAVAARVLASLMHRGTVGAAKHGVVKKCVFQNKRLLWSILNPPVENSAMKCSRLAADLVRSATIVGLQAGAHFDFHVPSLNA